MHQRLKIISDAADQVRGAEQKFQKLLAGTRYIRLRNQPTWYPLLRITSVMLGIEDAKEAGNRHNSQGHPQKDTQKGMHSLQQASPSLTQPLFLCYIRGPLSPDYLFNLPQHTALLSAAPILSRIGRSIVRMELSLPWRSLQPVTLCNIFCFHIPHRCPGCASKAGLIPPWVHCGRPLGCKRKNENSDGRIDCDHVSGLCWRGSTAAGPNGVRDPNPNTNAALKAFAPNGFSGSSVRSDRHLIQLFHPGINTRSGGSWTIAAPRRCARHRDPCRSGHPLLNPGRSRAAVRPPAARQDRDHISPATRRL